MTDKQILPEMNQERSLSSLSKNICHYLSGLFPVTCSSDEFWFFPQVIHEYTSLNAWDHFSNETVSECCKKLSSWHTDIQKMMNINHPSTPTEIDAFLLSNMIQTLQEHLEHFRPWERQPTFHLSIACIGLAQALTYGRKSDLTQRISKLPDFLKRASMVIHNVPELFMASGLKMVNDTRIFFQDCLHIVPDIKKSINALNDFHDTLIQMKTINSFLLPVEDYAHLVKSHMQTQLDLKTIEEILEQEIQFNKEKIQKFNTTDFLVAQKHLIKPEKNSPLQWFSNEVQRLKAHCIKHHLITEQLKNDCSVQIEPVPDFLKTIRTASSYSFSPFQKSCHGTFYVLSDETQQKGSQYLSEESPMLTAHETYPGHHLLDASRSMLNRKIRRPLESPLFYEGWACFGEILMLETQFYQSDHASVLINKRRLWRAIRGKIDLFVHSGKMSFDEAADLLCDAGIDFNRASQIVRQYPLHPGYQLSYSIGLQQFQRLYSQKKLSMDQWVQTVLSEGEIPFDLLENILMGHGSDRSNLSDLTD
jgi:hypothetical protein